MNNKYFVLSPWEYWFSKQQTSELVRAYHSVNDLQTIQSLQLLIREQTAMIFERNATLQYSWELLLDRKLTHSQFEKIFAELKSFVTPMKAPSIKQLDKCFRKVKKMRYPDFQSIDFQELSYLGWHDTGTNRKYLVCEKNGGFTGVYGSFSPTLQKGHCAICNQISTVGLFLATTKTAGDGTYTKKGNYICGDSGQCNRQITQLDSLESFWQTILS